MWRRFKLPPDTVGEPAYALPTSPPGATGYQFADSHIKLSLTQSKGDMLTSEFTLFHGKTSLLAL